MGSSKLQHPQTFAEKFSSVLAILFELEEADAANEEDDDPEPAKWLQTLLKQYEEQQPNLSALTWEPDRLALPPMFSDLLTRSEKLADSAARMRLVRPLLHFVELPKPKAAPESVAIANDHLWRSWDLQLKDILRVLVVLYMKMNTEMHPEILSYENIPPNQDLLDTSFCLTAALLHQLEQHRKGLIYKDLAKKPQDDPLLTKEDLKVLERLQQFNRQVGSLKGKGKGKATGGKGKAVSFSSSNFYFSRRYSPYGSSFGKGRDKGKRQRKGAWETYF